MSRADIKKQPPELQPRQRLSRDDRYRQLLEMARKLIRKEGTEALTLARLAEQAGVTKPVVYDHFGTRSGLLIALYQDFDVRQTAIMDAELEASKPTLNDKATALASSYVDCVLQQGREIPEVIAALAGSPELEKVKREYQRLFIEKCRKLLTPFVASGQITSASLWAMLGAADALSHAAAVKQIMPAEAKEELFQTIVALVRRGRKGTGGA